MSWASYQSILVELVKRLTRSITIIEGRCDIQVQEEKDARLITKIFTRSQMWRMWISDYILSKIWTVIKDQTSTWVECIFRREEKKKRKDMDRKLDHAHQGIMRGSWARVLRPVWFKKNEKWVLIDEPGLTREPVRGGFKPRVGRWVASPFRVDEKERRGYAWTS